MLPRQLLAANTVHPSRCASCQRRSASGRWRKHALSRARASRKRCALRPVGRPTSGNRPVVVSTASLSLLTARPTYPNIPPPCPSRPKRSVQAVYPTPFATPAKASSAIPTTFTGTRCAPRPSGVPEPRERRDDGGGDDPSRGTHPHGVALRRVPASPAGRNLSSRVDLPEGRPTCRRPVTVVVVISRPVVKTSCQPVQDVARRVFSTRPT